MNELRLAGGDAVLLAAARQSFKEHEALVYTQLAQLIKDGVWLKSYIAAVMRVEQTVHPVHSVNT